MVWPQTPLDVEVGLFLNGAWVNAVTTGNGVRHRDEITIDHGRSNWASVPDPGSCQFTLDNRDGRWSPDNPSSPYFGQYRRNIPCRVGIGRGEMHMRPTGVGADLASTPDLVGGGGGGSSGAAPTFVSNTPTTVTTDSTTHAVAGPATVATGDRLLLVVSAGHDSLTPKDQGGGITDLDGWTLVASSNLYTPWHKWMAYEIEASTSTLATALSGQTFEFSTTTACRSSAQVLRTSGARSGGSGTAWSVAVTSTPTTFGANPDPPSVTAPWGAYNHRWYTFAIFGTGGDTVSTYPASYTTIASTGSSSTGHLYVASAHRTTGVATENPGTYTLTGSENWHALTFVYRAVEVAGSDGALDIAGDIDVRIEFELEQDLVDITKGGHKARLAHKSSGANGWELELYQALGNVVANFIWRDASGVTHDSTTEATGAVIPLDFQHEHRALRVTLDVNNGASGHTVTWYTSTTLAGTWTQLGSPVVVAGTTAIKTNDAPLRVGGNPFDGTVVAFPGKIYAFQLRNGIGGTIVANPAFNAQAAGATGFTDSATRVWSIGTGGRITNMLWRFHGELSSLPVRWNINGSDITAPVEAAGLFRRLRQGNRVLESAIRRAILRGGLTGLVQYWPMEEQADGPLAQFGPAVGSAALVISGEAPDTASVDRFSASSALPTLGTAALTADVDDYTASGAWQVRWLQYIPSNFTGDGLYFMRVETTDMVWEVEYRDDAGGQLNVHAYRGLTEVYSTGYISFNCTGKAFRMTFSVKQNGGSVDLNIEGQPQGGASGGLSVTAAVAGSAGVVNRLKINKDANVGSWAFGHVTLQSAKTTAAELFNELNAYNGERAGARIERLLLEEGIPFRIEGDPADTESMGPQRAGTLMNLLQECADTDLGILHESRETVAVGYRTRASMLDQPIIIDLDYAGGNLAGSPELDRDDQDFANDVTVKNRAGNIARAVLDDGSPLSVSEPPVGAGRYDRSYSVNALDSRLPQLATTRLALTTVDEPRVSRLPLGMHHASMVADVALTSSIFDASLGDRVVVSNNLSAALGTATIDQLIQGTRETLSSFTHHIDLLTTPSSPWFVDGGVTPPDEGHTVTFRSGLSLVTGGAPQHVLRALGYTGAGPVARADLDAILDAWVASTGGTTRNVTSSASWTTAMAAALPGDLIRVTTGFTADITARGSRYSLGGANMTASTAGGTAGKPIIVTCANGVSVTGTSTASNAGVLDVFNTTHVWPIGFNTIGGQFGIRCWNWGGTAGSPAYRAYCNVTGTGHSAYSAQGWFQLITTSGGTPPAGSGNEWGFSQYFVDEENYAGDVGNTADAFGECFYYGRGSAPGWVSYCKDFWHRGNEGTLFTADGIDLKPGCHRFWVTDNRYHGGYCVFGSPMTINYVSSDLDARPAWMPADVEGYLEGNRVWDINITSANGSSANIGAYSGLSGLRWYNNMFWGLLMTGFAGGIYIRNEKGTDDTTAVATFGTAPTEFINNLYWGTAGAVVKGGYGVGVGFPDPYPVSVVFTERNNLADNLTGAQFQADTTDFIAAVPAVAAAGDAQWNGYGPGSAFDLALTSGLIGDGVSIADLNPFIDADISQRVFIAAVNPGPFQPHPANYT